MPGIFVKKIIFECWESEAIQMVFSHFTISQQGDSHIKTGKNCQDYSGSVSITNQKLNITFGIVAIADGVGSCDYSEYGSKIAVTTVLEALEKDLAFIDNPSDKGILSVLRNAYVKANDAIEREADIRELPFKLFDTTLTVTILTDNGICYVGHIGDDGVVALMADGTYSMITRRIEGEEANSVIPLSSADCWTFGVVQKPVAALVLLTDGLLDKAVGSERMHNRVYYPFFKSLFENIMETEKDIADFRNTWDGYLREKEFREGYGVTDDITLALIQLPAILKKVKPMPFDEEKWNEASEKARQEIEDALSNNSKTHSEDRDEIISQKVTRAEKTAQPAEALPTVQQPVNSASLHDGNTPHANFSETSQAGQRMITSTVNSNQNNGASGKALRILIPVISVIILLGGGLFFRKIGYDAGVAVGKQQERLLIQEQLEELKTSNEKSLQAEYDRGFHDAEMALTNETKDEEVTQPYKILPWKLAITRRGQKSETVKAIQMRLISKGWSIKADGIYGELTEQAIREFQQLNALPVTGEVDLLTFWSLVDKNSKGMGALSHDAGPSPATAPVAPDNDSINPDSTTESL